MSTIRVNNKVLKNDIVSSFVSDVKDVILRGVYHSGRIPVCRGYVCVPSYMLGNLSSIGSPTNAGTTGNIVSASTIYNALVDVTRTLTRVGTFSFSVLLQTDSGYLNMGSLSGSALFSASYIRTLPTVANGGVTSKGSISARSLNSLISNCLAAYNSASKYHHSSSYKYCHSSCHSNCHQNCYDNCHTDCYMNGKCYESVQCWDCRNCYIYVRPSTDPGLKDPQ